MAETVWGTIGEVFVGWVVIPRIIFFLVGFIVTFLGYEPATVLIVIYVVQGLLTLGMFFWKKAIAIGMAIDLVLSLIGVYGFITGLF